MSKKIIILIVVFMILSNAPAFAVTDTTETTTTVTPSTTTTTLPIKTQAETLRGDIRTAVGANKMAIKDAIMSKTEAFKSQIALLKDEKKKIVVERINDNIVLHNTRLTGKMTDALTRMTNMLERLKQKSATLKTAGRDTKSLDAAIAGAQTAITNAQTQVTAQAQKVYTAPTLTDSNLKTAIGQMFTQFKTDIMAAYQAVNSARKAVVVAITELAKISGDKTATSSAVQQ